MLANNIEKSKKSKKYAKKKKSAKKAENGVEKSKKFRTNSDNDVEIIEIRGNGKNKPKKKLQKSKKLKKKSDNDVEIIEIREKTSKNSETAMNELETPRPESFRRTFPKKGKSISPGFSAKSEVMKGTETQFKNFVIDRTVTPQNRLKSKEVQEMCVEKQSTSTWAKTLMSTMLGGTPISTGKRPPFRSKKSCYNCDGEHNLSDCPKPRNFRRISEKKRLAGDEIRQRQMQYGRITDHHTEQSNIEPGVISSELREALNIGPKDIPEYIYRMRKMGFVKGYPPGYLKKAIKNHGGQEILKFFDDSAKNEKKLKTRSPELDPSKVITYPGFNELDDTLTDLEKHFKIPPLSVFCENLQIELRDLFNREQKAEYKRKKRENKKIKFNDDDEEDVIFIDTVPMDVGKMPGEENEIVIFDGIQENSTKTPKKKVHNNDDSIKEGESLFCTIGTPVLNTRNADGSFKRALELPPIEAFSVGIIPFEANEECTENRGTFKRLMTHLRQKRPQIPDEKQDETPKKKKTKKSTV